MSKRAVETKERFINPYTFVSLGGQVVRSKPTDGDLTGKISCSLRVHSPLAVPDAEQRTAEDVGKKDPHYSYPFFRIGDTAVIPGSQIRGVLRSVYEALSNSCLSVNNNNILSARHTSPRKPGILCWDDKTGWHLYEAEKEKLFEDGQDIRAVTRKWYGFKNKSAVTDWRFIKKQEVHVQADLKKAVDDYNENLKIYEDNADSPFKKIKDRLGRTYEIIKGKECPVFYELINNGKVIYLSPSQIGRSVFTNRVDDLLGSHRSCRLEKGLCKGCMLFGLIRSSNSRASRVRISDAVCEHAEKCSEVTLKPLAGPKSTAVEFYTQRPQDARWWTYDYCVTNDRIKELCKVLLNGRKFYWHHPRLQPSDYTAGTKTNLNSTVEVCPAGSTFRFDIFFERITEEQLRELLWALTFGENDPDGRYQHKLGHGKPLGLGDVKFTVQKVTLRRIEKEPFRYILEEHDADEYLRDNPFDEETVQYQEMLAIMDRNTLLNACNQGAKVTYPIGDDGKNKTNSKAAHQWFKANREMGSSDGTSTNWSVKYTLPKTSDSDRTLPAVKYEEAAGRGNDRGSNRGGNYRNGNRGRKAPKYNGGKSKTGW